MQHGARCEAGVLLPLDPTGSPNAYILPAADIVVLQAADYGSTWYMVGKHGARAHTSRAMLDGISD